MSKFSKTASSLCLSFAVTAGGVAFSIGTEAGPPHRPQPKKNKGYEPPATYLKDGQAYTTMKEGGVEIPVSSYKTLDDGRLQIIINGNKISPFSYVFAKNATFSANGFDDARECPYVNFNKEDYTVSKTSDDTYTVTTKINGNAAKHIEKSGCVITRKPPFSELF